MTCSKISTEALHKIPQDLHKALAADSKVLKLWNSLTPLAQNE